MWPLCSSWQIHTSTVMVWSRTGSGVQRSITMPSRLAFASPCHAGYKSGESRVSSSTSSLGNCTINCSHRSYRPSVSFLIQTHFSLLITFSQERSAQATFNLGFMHEFGVGVQKDLKLARKYYLMAKHTQACSELAGTWAEGATRFCILAWLLAESILSSADVPTPLSHPLA